jgi:hypothetical protein
MGIAALLAAVGLPGAADVPQNFGAVGPYIRAGFQFGPGAVDLLLSGNNGALLPADPNLALFMNQNDEFSVTLDGYHFEILPAGADYDLNTQEQIVAVSNLALEHNRPGAGRYLYPAVGYTNLAAAAPRNFADASAAPFQSLDVANMQEKRYHMRVPQRWNMATDTLRLFTVPGGQPIPASNPLVYLVMHGYAINNGYLPGGANADAGAGILAALTAAADASYKAPQWVQRELLNIAGKVGGMIGRGR